MFDITGMLIIVIPLVAVIVWLAFSLHFANQENEELTQSMFDYRREARKYEHKYIECRDSEELINGRIIETVDTHRIYISNVARIKRIDNLPVDKMYQIEVDNEYFK